MFRFLLLTAALTWSGCGIAQTTGLAQRFGARDGVIDVAIAPDGKTLAIVRSNGPRGTIVATVPLDGAPTLKGILSASGNPERLTSCGWANGERLVCSLYLIDVVNGQKLPFTRLMALNADGSDMRMLSARGTDRSYGIALGGGSIIDWQGDDNGDALLMTRWFVPENSTGTLIVQRNEGYGVERVNPRTFARTTVEAANAAATTYITDGRGSVRIVGIAQRNTKSQSLGVTEYRYRRKGDRAWQTLGKVTYSNYHSTGFVPVAVDPDLDVAYGFDASAGRQALFRVSLDGSLRKELVLARPDADVDQLIRVGRQQRVIGASWITDRRQAAIFDPEYARLVDRLGNALPGKPGVTVVDATADEQRLVLFAGSDIDPGRFYLYDKSTKRLSEIMAVREPLAKVKLSPVKSVLYPAADGTMVPAYLTLPPAGTGKNLPAIVLPHGGPSYRDEWSFDWLPQYFASRGYAVIQPNYRGSTGYGRAWFMDNGIRSWRTSIGDVADAGRWLVTQGIADPAKLAIVGWSYGGYAALQSQVVAPNLFKAAVAIAPVTDFGAVRAQIERENGETREALDGIFGDSRVAAEGSPARHAAAFTAPVLMFHGSDDINVDISQSRLMRDRLKSAGKAVELVEFDGLDHQLDDNQARATTLERADAFLRNALHLDQ